MPWRHADLSFTVPHATGLVHLLLCDRQSSGARTMEEQLGPVGVAGARREQGQDCTKNARFGEQGRVVAECQHYFASLHRRRSRSLVTGGRGDVNKKDLAGSLVFDKRVGPRL